MYIAFVKLLITDSVTDHLRIVGVRLLLLSKYLYCNSKTNSSKIGSIRKCMVLFLFDQEV